MLFCRNRQSLTFWKPPKLSSEKTASEMKEKKNEQEILLCSSILHVSFLESDSRLTLTLYKC